MQAAITSAVPVVSVTVPGPRSLRQARRRSGPLRPQRRGCSVAGPATAAGPGSREPAGAPHSSSSGSSSADAPAAARPPCHNPSCAGRTSRWRSAGIFHLRTGRSANRADSPPAAEAYARGQRYPVRVCASQSALPAERAGDLRQAGGFVKCLVVQHTAQSLGLIFRAAVQPHQKGAKRLARTVRGA